MKVLTDNKYYGQIADVIREQNGTSNTYTPPQMVSALKDLFYEEVEGVPPISFNGIGENLLDYRIDGASGGVGERTKNLCPYNKVNNSIIAHVESGKTYSFSLFASFLIGFNLMKRNASSQSTSSVATKYNSEGNVSVTFTADEDFDLFVNGFSSISGKTFLESVSNFQLEESSTVTDYEPYGYKVPVTVEGKNLLQNTATSQTIKGLTFTVNTDGSVTCNGRRENTTTFFTIANVTTSGKIILSGCPSGGSSTSFAMRAFSATVSNPKVYYDIGDSCMLNTPDTYNIDIRIQSNYACDNLTFYPMIRKADIEDDTYEPYIEPTTTNIYLDNPIRTVEDEVEYIDYSEQKQHRVRKNLLQNTATTQTINGVTFTVNNDKSITCNGTATGTTAITINTIFSINSTKISGCPMGGSWSSFELDLLNINTNNVDVIDTGNGAVIQNENSYRVRIRIASGYTCNNLTFYPMIRKADIEDDTYEPYIENTEVDVTLPAIPTLDGTNTLSIGTTVQPSNVYVKSRHESSYEAAMRERYEEAQAQLDALESGGE